MRLFHGTTEAIAKRSLTDGLKPRMLTNKKTNWKINPSRKDMIYLSETYAPYFAVVASAASRSKIGLIEINVDSLDKDNLFPDEDFLEQASKGDQFGLSRDMSERTLWFRDNLESFQHHWIDSFDKLGNVCYKGIIDRTKIKKVIIYNYEKNIEIGRKMVDPSISIVNHCICGEKYRKLTQWLFGEEVKVEEIFDMYEIMPDDMKEQAKRIFENREGIEILK